MQRTAMGSQATTDFAGASRVSTKRHQRPNFRVGHQRLSQWPNMRRQRKLRVSGKKGARRAGRCVHAVPAPVEDTGPSCVGGIAEEDEDEGQEFVGERAESVLPGGGGGDRAAAQAQLHGKGSPDIVRRGKG